MKIVDLTMENIVEWWLNKYKYVINEMYNTMSVRNYLQFLTISSM